MLSLQEFLQGIYKHCKRIIDMPATPWKIHSPPWVPLTKEIVEKEDNGNVVMKVKVSTNTLRDGGEGDVFGSPPAPHPFLKADLWSDA